MAIATLSIDLVAKLANIERDMGRAANIAQRNADRMKRAFTGVSRALAGLGVGLSAGFIASIVTGTAQAADALAKLSQKTGIAVEDLSRLQYASELSGVSNEQLTTGLRTLSQRMGDAAKGTGEAAAAFEAMGVSVKNTDGSLRGQQEVLRDVADRFAGYADGAAKSALAQRIFGRAGAELIPLLNSGAKGLKDMADESDRLGRTMSTETAKAAEEFNDNMTRLRASAEGLKNMIAGPLIRSLADMTTEMFRAARQGETLMGVIERMFRGGLAGNRASLIDAAADIERLAFEHKKLQEQIAKYDGQQVPFELLEGEGFASANLASARKNFLALAAEQNKTVTAGAKLEPPTLAAAGGGGRGRSAAKSVIDEQQKIFDSVQKQIGALQQQAASFGLSERAATLYKLSIAGANDAQLESANAVLTEIEALKSRTEMQTRAKSIYEQTRTPVEALNAEIATLNDLFNAGALDVDTYGRAVAAAQDSFTDLANTGKDKFSELQTAIDGWGKSSASALADFAMGGKASFGDMAKSIIADMIQMIAYQNIMKPLFDSIGASAGGGSFLGSLFGGARAMGGSVSSGKTYLVGERGPELLTMGGSGHVTPNHKLGGGGGAVSITINNNAGGDTQASARSTTDSMGNTQIQVMVEKVEGMIGRRIGQGGGLAPMLEGRYGLNPAAGARR